MRTARHSTTARRTARIGAATIACALAVAGGAYGAVAAASSGGGVEPESSVQLDGGLCQTSGGGAFVPIPGFPGESIDQRLLADIAWMVKRYKIFITDGYSTSSVHTANGEHPIGLAIDVVPNTAAGGKWRKINKLARWAEPKQNQPRAPFRWVGYNGDANHGRGNHLHLSWMHSQTKPKVPADTVYTRFCPGAGTPEPPPAEPALNQIMRSLPDSGPQHDDAGVEPGD